MSGPGRTPVAAPQAAGKRLRRSPSHSFQTPVMPRKIDAKARLLQLCARIGYTPPKEFPR